MAASSAGAGLNGGRSFFSPEGLLRGIDFPASHGRVNQRKG